MKIKHCFFLTGCLLNSLCFGTVDYARIDCFNEQIPHDVDLRERILTTCACDDCDTLPRCEDAGKVIEAGDISYQVMHNGIKILPDCYYGHWMTILINLLNGHHEPQEEKAFHEVLSYMPQDAVMLELGSYWGYYSLWFKKQLPSATTYLVEPDIKNLAIGQKNYALNNFEGDFTFAMVGSTPAKAALYTSWDYETSFVPQISIDDFAHEKNLSYIHILHSDIQGAEVDMLEGCRNLINERRVGYFFISTHRGTHEKCLDALEGKYDILLSLTRPESFSADGLIIARSPDLNDSVNFEVTKRTQEIQEYIKDLNDKTLSF